MVRFVHVSLVLSCNAKSLGREQTCNIMDKLLIFFMNIGYVCAVWFVLSGVKQENTEENHDRIVSLYVVKNNYSLK